MFLGSPRPHKLRFDSVASIRRDGADYILPIGLLEGPVKGLTRTRSVYVTLSLPERVFMERQLELPGLTATAAESAARLDLIRRTPFRPEEVYASLARSAGNASTFHQYVIRRSDVTALAERIRELGFNVGEVRLEGSPHLLPFADLSDQALPARRMWRWLNGTLAVALAGTLCWLWLNPGFAERDASQALATEVSALRERATELRREVDDLRADRAARDAFLGEIIGRPRLVEIIRNLTVALPDDTWVSDLVYNGSGVVVSGATTQSAAELVLELSKRRDIINPRLSGPVARLPSGEESFELAIDLVASP